MGANVEVEITKEWMHSCIYSHADDFFKKTQCLDINGILCSA